MKITPDDLSGETSESKNAYTIWLLLSLLFPFVFIEITSRRREIR
jgi:hypothetical protein